MVINLYDVRRALNYGYTMSQIRRALADVKNGFGNFYDCVAYQSLCD